MKVNGRWPVDPSIYTPWTLGVVRIVRGALPVQATQLTAYLQGGTVGSFTVNACPPTATPKVGATFLVWLGSELTTGEMGNAPIEEPISEDFFSYAPTTDIVTTRDGSMTLSDALKGLAHG